MNVEEQVYKMCTKCFDTLPFKMFYNCLRNYDEKLVGATNVQLYLERHYIQRRKLDYSHIFKRIKTTLMNFLLNNELVNITIFSPLK